jgi:hypothetical protein
MAVNVNLSRNTKVYYTINQATTGYGDHNTAEIQVLNGYTFSQGTDQQTIQITEAGATPNRGQRSFNTKLNPVDWKFSTYVRPQKNAATAAATLSAAGTVTLITVAGVVTNAEILTTFASGTSLATSGTLCTIAGFTGTSTPCNSTTPIPIKKVGAAYTWAVPVTAIAGAQAGTGTLTPVGTVTAPEAYLWNALVSPQSLFGSGVTQPWVIGTTSASLVTTASNVHQLAPFALIFKIDNTYYKVANCALNMAEVNFGIDQIAQVSWTGFGTSYASFESTLAQATEIAGLAVADTTADFITNKLSTVSLGTGLRAAITGTTGSVNATATPTYSIAITGGQISINNNLNYLTPENIGVVNQPIGYFTGTRAVTGNLTAYLRTGGTTETGNLLTAVIAAAATSADNSYSMILNMGGGLSATHVEFPFDGVMLQVPSIDVQDVVSTTINFTAQSSTGTHPTGVYDITAANEFGVTYKTV